MTNPTPEGQYVLVFGLFIILFPAIWLVVIIALSRLSGWVKLSKHYTLDADFEGEMWSHQSAMLKWVRYKGVLNVGANGDGLYLQPAIWFRFGHRPLFVPWRDITVEPLKANLLWKNELAFQRVPYVTLKISNALSMRLLTFAGENWHADLQASLAQAKLTFVWGGAHHPDGFGQWRIEADTQGTLLASHTVGDNPAMYGPYTLTSTENSQLWWLIQAANIRNLPQTFRRPGIPDETICKFTLNDETGTDTVEMWAGEMTQYQGVPALAQKLQRLANTYTGQTVA